MTSTAEVHRRLQFIEELEQFVHSCQEEMTSVLETLGWSPEKFVQQKTKVVCPHDPGHVMSPESLLKHEPVCGLVTKGVPREVAENEAMQSSKFFYERASSVGSYEIDKETLNKVLWNHHVKEHSIFYGKSDVPLTPEDEMVTLTPSERAALYDFLVHQAKADGKMVRLEQDTLLTANLEELVKKKGLEGDTSKPKSYLEYLKTMRDYKRRRQSYRAKNVHITKKSYTEIIREVIENQTDYLTEILKDDEEGKSTSSMDNKIKKSHDLASMSRLERKYTDGHEGSTERSKDRERSQSHYDDDNHRKRSYSRERSRSKRERSRSRHRDRDERDGRRQRNDDFGNNSRKEDSKSYHRDTSHHSNSPHDSAKTDQDQEGYKSSSSKDSDNSHRGRKKHKKHKHKKKHKSHKHRVKSEDNA